MKNGLSGVIRRRVFKSAQIHVLVPDVQVELSAQLPKGKYRGRPFRRREVDLGELVIELDREIVIAALFECDDNLNHRRKFSGPSRRCLIERELEFISEAFLSCNEVLKIDFILFR